MSLTGPAHVWVRVTAVVAGLAAVGLTLLAVLADLSVAGRAASVTGAVVGLAVSIVTLLRGGGSASGPDVRAGRGGIAAGGNITGSAIGNSSRVTGRSTKSSTGDITANASGDDGTVGNTPPGPPLGDDDDEW